MKLFIALFCCIAACQTVSAASGNQQSICRIQQQTTCSREIVAAVEDLLRSLRLQAASSDCGAISSGSDADASSGSAGSGASVSPSDSAPSSRPDSDASSGSAGSGASVSPSDSASSSGSDAGASSESGSWCTKPKDEKSWGDATTDCCKGNGRMEGNGRCYNIRDCYGFYRCCLDKWKSDNTPGVDTCS